MTNDKKKPKERSRPRLGRGLAEGAARAIERRKRTIEQQIDEAAGFKRNE